jgi:hypothetical protein
MKTDFPRWIAWSVVGAVFFMALTAFPRHLPQFLVAAIVVLICPLSLYVRSAGAAGWIAAGFGYFLVISAILLLPLLFREKRWKLIGGGVALVLLISALAINLLLLARWAG